MARHASGPRPGVLVTVFTVLALGVVAFLGYQASAGDDRPLAGRPNGVTGTADGETGGGRGDAERQRREEREAARQRALPDDSGSGRRVVYALERQRVWLVDPAESQSNGEAVIQTHEVFRSSVDPPPGEYVVESRISEITGSDGVPVEHVMIFHTAEDGTVFGFSSALDGSRPDPDAELRTGGVRQSRGDGDAMWAFAEEGTSVVVVP